MPGCGRFRGRRFSPGCGGSGTILRCRHQRKPWSASTPSRRPSESCSAATGRSPIRGWWPRHCGPTRPRCRLRPMCATRSTAAMRSLFSLPVLQRRLRQAYPYEWGHIPGGTRMTQIRPLAQPVRRRPGELGVHSLDRFNFAVPDLAAARNFYASFGLDVRERPGALDIHTHGHAHRWGSVTEGPRKKLKFISFGTYEDDLPRFRERLDGLGIARQDPPPGAESNGLWFCDPDGTLIEITVAEKTSPDAKSSFYNAAGGPAVRCAPGRSQVPVVRPRRLAH